MDNNDDNGLGDNNADYGNEDYDGAQGDNNNNNGDAGANNEGDVDQYFDDAGDIGYLPADHVTPSLISLTVFLAPHATSPERLDQAAHG